jgi:predicted phage tail protein
MKIKQSIVVFLIILLLVVSGVFIYFIFYQKKLSEQQKRETEGLLQLYKEELADEYNQLSIQYEGFKLQINNDSLVAQLEAEQLKVQRLQEELRTVKTTDAKRINELKKELETLRTIMRSYVAQIDSLDRLNKELEHENKQVTARYQEVTQTVSQLTQEKEQLIETVNIAAKLDAANIIVRGITNKNKVTDKIKKMDQLEIQFTINKNITAKTGEKNIYIRIQKPDDDVLVKNHADVFIYENKKINYSAKRIIEYMGEETTTSIYWKIEEFLSPGMYRVDIFADGNLIGEKSFKLDN